MIEFSMIDFLKIDPALRNAGRMLWCGARAGARQEVTRAAGTADEASPEKPCDVACILPLETTRP